ncbi:hypothetical protein J2Z83_003749 [Virgibacillus natechei]|uniref:Uncharacterized protein n=1 Tax=Virgibacillus natechei TaxID=1216297 RepID=A0ABS4IKV9_9BACI|nr:hypothetical protein [Virgibacillus natechei]MBP1971598.1 hypothetical protein [Virgibacillus natechei]UZD13071.1 hypothetical protein OLD84_00380 [Virgibacillus natechei]
MIKIFESMANAIESFWDYLVDKSKYVYVGLALTIIILPIIKYFF